MREPNEIAAFVQRLEERQRRGALSTLIGLFVAVAVALSLIALSFFTVKSNLAQVTALQAILRQNKAELARVQGERDRAVKEVDQAKQEVVKLRSQIDTLETQLRESAKYKRFIHPINWTDAKVLVTQNPRAQGLVLALGSESIHRIPWRPQGGGSPQAGFNSPGFAAFLLCGTGVLRDYREFGTQEALRAHFSPAATPEVGDLALYDGGFTMFYFKDAKGDPFVFGMTLVGTVSLDPDFARHSGYLKIINPSPSEFRECK